MARAKTDPPPQRTAVPNINLDGELRVLDGFTDDWLKLHKQQIVLSKKASISNNEFSTFKSSSEGLKNRCSQFQTAIRDVSKKLKESGQWNSLDDDLLARTSNEKFKSAVRENGGAKRILEDASSQFCSQAEREITEPIDRLRPKLSAQVQDLFLDQRTQTPKISHHAPVPVFKYALRCTGSIIRILGRMVVGKDQFEGQAYKNWECFCLEECGTASPT